MGNSILHSMAIPVYGAAWNLDVAFRDATGAEVAPTSPDTEVSLDNGSFVDATNEIALAKLVDTVTDSSLGYVTLTAAEMSAGALKVQVKSANCRTRMFAIHPRRLGVVRTGTAQAGANGTITLDTGACTQDAFYRGLIVRIDSGTGAGQARLITSYVGSTRVASIAPNWEVNPANDSIFTIGVIATNNLSVSSFLDDSLSAAVVKADAVTKITTGLAIESEAGAIEAAIGDINVDFTPITDILTAIQGEDWAATDNLHQIYTLLTAIGEADVSALIAKFEAVFGRGNTLKTLISVNEDNTAIAGVIVRMEYVGAEGTWYTQTSDYLGRTFWYGTHVDDGEGGHTESCDTGHFIESRAGYEDNDFTEVF